MESADVVSDSVPSLICVSSYLRDLKWFITSNFSAKSVSNKMCPRINTTRCFILCFITLGSGFLGQIGGKKKKKKTLMCKQTFFLFPRQHKDSFSNMANLATVQSKNQLIIPKLLNSLNTWSDPGTVIPKRKTKWPQLGFFKNMSELKSSELSHTDTEYTKVGLIMKLNYFIPHLD